ncbi:MAG: hypothetical protein KDB07_08750 [Planctomycetes bacterium]|nr:hypothetical protein [Planctomycetota bacterium]
MSFLVSLLHYSRTRFARRKLTRRTQCCQKLLGLVLGLSMLLGLGGCSSLGGVFVSEQSKPELPSYTIQAIPLEEPAYNSDGYEILLGFEVHSDDPQPWTHLIQEIQHDTYFTTESGRVSLNRVTLVEAFELRHEEGEHRYLAKLPHSQRDRHFESGFLTVSEEIARIEVHRRVNAYLGVVEGADFTYLGFAHLPHNEDGSFYTLVPTNFNRQYQDNHETRGRIVWSDRDAERCNYSIRYTWAREGAREPDANLFVRLNPEEREVSAGGREGKAP